MPEDAGDCLGGCRVEALLEDGCDTGHQGGSFSRVSSVTPKSCSTAEGFKGV